MFLTIVILLALFGGLSFGLGLLAFLAWLAVAELHSIWKSRRKSPLARALTHLPREVHKWHR